MGIRCSRCWGRPAGPGHRGERARRTTPRWSVPWMPVPTTMVKPYTTEQLEARIRAVLRRSVPDRPGHTVVVGGLVLDLTARTASSTAEAWSFAPRVRSARHARPAPRRGRDQTRDPRDGAGTRSTAAGTHRRCASRGCAAARRIRCRPGIPAQRRGVGVRLAAPGARCVAGSSCWSPRRPRLSSWGSSSRCACSSSTWPMTVPESQARRQAVGRRSHRLGPRRHDPRRGGVLDQPRGTRGDGRAGRRGPDRRLEPDRRHPDVGPACTWDRQPFTATLDHGLDAVVPVTTTNGVDVVIATVPSGQVNRGRAGRHHHDLHDRGAADRRCDPAGAPTRAARDDAGHGRGGDRPPAARG